MPKHVFAFKDSARFLNAKELAVRKKFITDGASKGLNSRCMRLADFLSNCTPSLQSFFIPSCINTLSSSRLSKLQGFKINPMKLNKSPPPPCSVINATKCIPFFLFFLNFIRMYLWYTYRRIIKTGINHLRFRHSLSNE